MKKIIFILILIVFISCSKEKKDYYTVVKGTVSNVVNNDYIEGYSLVIREQKAELFSWSYTLEILKTDSVGRFEFSFEAKGSYIYSIVSVDNNDFDEISDSFFVKGKTNEFNFKVYPVEVMSKE